MTQAAFIILMLGAWWTFMILMVLLTAYYREWRSKTQHRTHPADSLRNKRCLLIRPCSGDEGGFLFDCLTSAANIQWDVALEVIIGVDSTDDPAFPIASRAAMRLNEAGIHSKVEIAPVIGPNRKVSILAGCLAKADTPPDIVISADSAVDFSGMDMNRFVASLASPNGPAALWAPIRIHTPKNTLGDIASEAVLHSSWHSFGLLSRIDPHGMMGKLFAIHRDALKRIGGFESLVRYLGEDMEMSKRLHHHGLISKSDPQTVKTVSGTTTWKETVARHARWITVIKAQRSALLLSYPLLFFNAPLVYTASIFGMLYHMSAGLLCLLSALLLRLLVGASASRMLGIRHRLPELAIHAFISDGLLLRAFIQALWMRKVAWRGKTFTFTKSGELTDC